MTLDSQTIMAPDKVTTKSPTPRGSPSSGKHSAASNFSEVSLPEAQDSTANGNTIDDTGQDKHNTKSQDHVQDAQPEQDNEAEQMPKSSGSNRSLNEAEQMPKSSESNQSLNEAEQMPKLSGSNRSLNGIGTPVRGSPALGSLRVTPRPGTRSDSVLSHNSEFSTSPASMFWKNIKPDTDIIFVKPLDSRFECALCNNVLRYPTKLECGHHCCSSCMVEIMRTEPRCPIDQSKVEKRSYSIDRGLQKEIETLFIRCSDVTSGCSWSGYLKELIIHFETCGYQTVSCTNECLVEFERRFLKKHLENDCSRRLVPCQYCKMPVKLDEMKVHLETCDRIMVPCTNQCGKEVPRDEIQKHLDDECAEQNANCPFFDSGCPFEAKRKDLKAHVMQALDVHFDMMIQSLRTCSDALEIHDAIWERQSLRLIDVENQVGVLNKIHGHQILWKIDQYQKKKLEASERITIAVESPVFQLFRDGYKFQLSACLNGDGKAAGKYMSLYVCIMKGDYDALLPWPFALQLTVTLMDQNKNPAKRNDHNQVVRPHACPENIPFLRRPTTDRNPAFGLVRFIALDKMSEAEYVKNDVMYIRVKVDPTGVMKL